MAASLLALTDLINFQLERFRLDNFVFKDELHLQRKLLELEHQQPSGSRNNSRQSEHTQALPNPEKILNRHPSSQKSSIQKRIPRQEITHLVPDIELGELHITETRRKHNAPDNDDFRDHLFSYEYGSTTTITSIAGSVGEESIDSSSSSGIRSNRSNTREFRRQVLEWFQQLRQQTSNFKSEEESKLERDMGNKTYRMERNSLKACDYYTEALFRAPVNSIAAAMAHANRSTVLHDCGMFEQAYDDCLCALDLGYPEEFHPIIKLRQASCALQMRNFTSCEEHLHELLHMELTELFQTRTYDIWHECEQLKSKRIETGIQTDENPQWNGAKVYEVAWSDSNSSSIRTTANVMENTPIFQEDTSIFVTTGETRICDNCAITQFIPFPCLICSNRTAVYCSRKCRTKHSYIHAMECFAHQIELFEEFANICTLPRNIQLAMRMLITGLPQVMTHCRKRPTVNKLWAAINGVLTEREDIEYSSLLRLESYVDKEDTMSTVTLAIIAHIIVIYLIECTDFIKQIELKMPASQKLTLNEWELIASALLLRHIFQLQHRNLICCPSFALPTDSHILSPINEFIVWANYKHVRAGYLHLIAGNVTTIALAVYPRTLSLCQHACDASIYSKFSGRCMITYATTDIPAGTTIYNCFSIYNYRQSLHETRKEELSYRGINCKCEKCIRAYPDEDFHKFHRYRCDNPNCRQIFTPSDLKRTNNLRWWKNNYNHILIKYISFPTSCFDDIHPGFYDNNDNDDGVDFNEFENNGNPESSKSKKKRINKKSKSKKGCSDGNISRYHDKDNNRIQKQQFSKSAMNMTEQKITKMFSADDRYGDGDDDNTDEAIITCSICKAVQKLEWFWTFNATLIECDTIENRCKLYAAYDRAENHLIDSHEYKAELARQLVEQCLCVQREATVELDEWEFNKLGSIMRSALPIVSAQYRVNSIQFVQHMAYFWDIMALSSYKCSDRELMQMLHAIECVPDEYKEIFINYYEDYIAPKFAEPTYMDNTTDVPNI